MWITLRLFTIYSCVIFKYILNIDKEKNVIKYIENFLYKNMNKNLYISNKNTIFSTNKALFL